MSNLIKHADRELHLAGLFDKDSDYGGMLGKAVMRLIHVHANEGHSGYSHAAVLDLFQRLANFKTLSPLTADPSEWMEVEDGKMWQSTRDPSAFSEDAGATWYSVDDPKRERRRSAPKVSP